VLLGIDGSCSNSSSGWWCIGVSSLPPLTTRYDRNPTRLSGLPYLKGACRERSVYVEVVAKNESCLLADTKCDDGVRPIVLSIVPSRTTKRF